MDARLIPYPTWLLSVLILFTPPALADGEQEAADTAFAEQRWAAAAAGYETLLAADADNPDNWFRLARCFDQMGKKSKALQAYLESHERGFAQPVRVQFAIARMLASAGDADAAIAWLQKVAEAGGPSFRTVENAPEFAAIRSDTRFRKVVDALRPCQTTEHRQFDFWLGHWDVTPAGSATPTASNRISLDQDGCTLIEEYVNGNFTGISLNFYDAVTDRWHQTWISNAGGAVYQEGGLQDDGSMAMTDSDLPISRVSNSINKTVWTPMPDGSVRQVWSNSTDGGANWTIVFDGLYVRKADAQPR